jgi:hypothetical protein
VTIGRHPRIKKQSAGFVGIFVPLQISRKTTASKAASHFQDEFMISLSRSTQMKPQVLRSKLLLECTNT